MTLTFPDPALGDDAVMLRPFSPVDVDQITAACQDPDLQRYIPVPRPYARHDAEQYVERTARQWAEGSKAAFAVVPHDDHGRILGAINLAISGPVGNSAYWVHPVARGEGVATRALRLVAQWALVDLGLGVVLLEIRPENTASMVVARGAGFHESGRIDVNTETGKRGGLLFSRLASDATER